MRLCVRLKSSWYNTPSVQSTHWALSLVGPTARGEVERGRSEGEEEGREGVQEVRREAGWWKNRVKRPQCIHMRIKG